MESVYTTRRDALGSLRLRNSGKVRDIYEVDEDHLLFVTSDRVSAFDVIMPRGIPHKGRVLTAIAAHWFEQTADLIPNHLVSTDPADVPGLPESHHDELKGRVMLVRKCEPTTVEWVLRGYIVGSGWKEYQERGSVCGVELPAGLEFCQKLTSPIFTPTTKDDTHDMPITAEQARERVGDAVYERAHTACFDLFERGTRNLAEIGILLADTKFEFGLCGGELYLIDEALTPDSSRFWPADEYTTGRNQPSYDKQILRDWLETLTWDKNPPAPELPDDIVARVSERYLQVCERITGRTPVGVTA